MNQPLLYLPQKVDFDRELIERLEGSGPRYTSYPTADRFHTGFKAADYQHWLSQGYIGANKKSLSVYVHVPFCNTICYYCGCNKIITKDKSRADLYLDYLEKELDLVTQSLNDKERLVQLHFGGGTPTFLSDEQLTRVMDMLRARFDFVPEGEYSIEIDPRKVSAQSIEHLAKLGFNRMSVGIQDFDPQVQEAVNRVQSEEETANVIEAARKFGFKSVSVDLIYGLPLQTTEKVAATLEKVLALSPDRVAFYNYAHLPHVFKPQRRIAEDQLPSSKDKLDILQNSVNTLTERGYVFIGMDHFAKPEDELAIALRQGRLQRNFQGYSTHADCDMIGIGVSSISKVGASYSQNERELEDYYAALDEGRLPVMRGMVLTQDDLLRRSIIQALMCRFALAFDAYEEVYQFKFKQYFAEELRQLEEFKAMGLLTVDDGFLVVEPRGRFLIRNIAMVFDKHLREKKTHAQYSKTI